MDRSGRSKRRSSDSRARVVTSRVFVVVNDAVHVDADCTG